MSHLLALLLLAAPTVEAAACEKLEPLPDTVQVAWVSTLEKTVRSGSWLEVVRVSDLRTWLRAKQADPLRLLQGLGMVDRKEKELGADVYKVTLFDVKKEWLCRPVEDRAEGEDLSGVPACEASQQRRSRPAKEGFTGCGYTLDTGASARGLDVFRIEWGAASAWGFCTLPLDRFLKGA